MHSLTQTLSILFISTLTEDPRVPVVPFRAVHGRGAGGLPPGGDADGAEAGQLQLRVHAQDAAVYPKPQHDGEIPGGLRNHTFTYVGDDIVLDSWNMTLTEGFISRRSEAIATFALCGFSGVLSLFITMGIIMTLVPHRRAWLAPMAIPLLVAGNFSNFMVGCFAGKHCPWHVLLAVLGGTVAVACHV
ncbi:hypothetical protein C0Q70_06093 [Pomacea canaliculata]|uniref:Concentrative nucleoside transporter C-terminal domain-containing protein n=1 Tax=Pomacea canaliculata TaxID=400727 RepID=A0A2T7PN19_POMCA|nr:hypothetical protein C0Q70_06093 [Pomacea canaliculata]